MDLRGGTNDRVCSQTPVSKSKMHFAGLGPSFGQNSSGYGRRIVVIWENDARDFETLKQR
jgi:hypothetical protein